MGKCTHARGDARRGGVGAMGAGTRGLAAWPGLLGAGITA